jgi:Uma2 family endonuclease
MGMTWQEVMDSPYLQNLPFKIELSKWGKVEMSPASNLHGERQGEIYCQLRKKRGGKVIIECSIQTDDGVRVADVAWISNALYEQFGKLTPYPRAPEVCVEIMSPGNTWAEMHMKAGLYLKAGAKEVWIEPLNGKRTTIKPE